MRQRLSPGCKGCEKREPRLLAENAPAAKLMAACQTQWRIGFAGATGLDYNALFSVAGALRIEIDEGVLLKIGILESMMLKMWSKESSNKRAK